MPSGAAMTLCVPVSSRGSLSPMPGDGSCAESVKSEGGNQESIIANISSFLTRLVLQNVPFHLMVKVIFCNKMLREWPNLLFGFPVADDCIVAT